MLRNLSQPDEGLGGKSLDSNLGLDELLLLGLSRDALDLDELSSLLLRSSSTVLSLDALVLLDASKEVSTRLGGLDVLDTEVDTLGDDATTNTLVDDDTDGTASDVPDGTSLTVVELVGHTLVESTITLDINDITDLVDGLETGKSDLAGLTEVLGEEVAGTSAITERVGHLKNLLLWGMK